MSASELAVQATASGVSRIYEDSQNAFDKAFELMNTQLLPMLGKGVTITADYFQDLAGRYVQFLMAQSVMQMILAIVIVSLAVYFIRKIRLNAEMYHEYGEGHIVGIVSLACVIIVSFGLFAEGVYDLVKLVFVPELRVYEELSDLYKQTK